jgi:peroxiredoxin Q/BCP
MLKVGDRAPDFTLPSDQGSSIRLSDFRGQRVVLFWYPTAGSQSCTTEACGFRDDFPDFQAIDAIVLGISPDTIDEQQKFSGKNGLPYPLLADPELKAANLYEVWGPKKMFGRDIMGILRTTFIIDEKGVIRAVFERVRTPGHSTKVLETLESLNTSE